MAPAMANIMEYGSFLDPETQFLGSWRYPVVSLRSGLSSMFNNGFQGDFHNNEISEYWKYIGYWNPYATLYRTHIQNDFNKLHGPNLAAFSFEPYPKDLERRSLFSEVFPTKSTAFCEGFCCRQLQKRVEQNKYKDVCCQEELPKTTNQQITSQNLKDQKYCSQSFIQQENYWKCPWTWHRDWMSQPVEQWTPTDTLEWVTFQLTYLGERHLASVKLEVFSETSGRDLKHLTVEDLHSMIPEYGEKLHYLLQVRLKYEEMRKDAMTQTDRPLPLQKVSQEISLNQDSKRNSAFSPVKRNSGKSNKQRDWMSKPLQQWTPTDTLEWVTFQLTYLGERHLASVKLEVFSETSGQELKDLTLEDLCRLLPEYGEKLYYVLQVRLKYEEMRSGPSAWNNTSQPPSTVCSEKPKEQTIERHSLSPSKLNSESQLRRTLEPRKNAAKKKRESVKEKQKPLRGLTKVKTHEKIGRVWEFIRDLLLDSSYRHIISWEDRERGVFRFLNSAEAAKLWGDKRANTSMDFKKFSRAIRYNYKMGYLQPVENSRLVYRFGAKASGWKTDSGKKSD